MADGWWNLNGAITSCVAAYQPIGAASYAASLSNLNNPGTNDAVALIAPEWDATNGWKFSSDALETNIVPSDGYSVIIRYSNAVNNSSSFMLSSLNPTPACYFELDPYLSSNMRFLYGNKAPAVSNGGKDNGVMAMTNVYGYYNGSPVVNFSGYTWSGTMATIRIGERNVNNAGGDNFTGYVQAVAIYNTNIDSYVSALTTAISGLPLTSVGLTATDFTLNTVIFDAPTLEVAAIPVDITAKDYTLSAMTFDTPTLDVAPVACRTLTIDAESRGLEIEAELRGIKIDCEGVTVYGEDYTYIDLTGSDLTLAQITLETPTLAIYLPAGVLFVFDDALTSQLSTAYPMLATAGIKGTIYVITGTVGDSGYLTWDNLETLNSDGWDIANHTATHPDLTTLTQEQVETEIETARDALNAHGFTGASRHVAYPYGNYNATVTTAMASALMKSGRIVGPDMVGTDPNVDGRYSLEDYNIQKSVSSATVISGIDAGIAAGKFPILMFHRILETESGQTDWSTAKFQAVIDHIILNGYQAYTISELEGLLNYYHGIME